MSCLPFTSTNLPTQTRAAKGFALLSALFFLILIPIERIAAFEIETHPRTTGEGVSAREQLKRRGSF
jgi:hypothetical protein